MSPLVLALVGFLLALWPAVAAHAEGACANLPPGSMTRTECEYIQARLQQQKALELSRDQSLDLAVRAADSFRCQDETAAEIRNLEGAPGEEIRGTYRNVGKRAVSEVIVGFALYDTHNQLVKTSEAAVLPRTIPPGGTGAFAVEVPSPSTSGWACFRYEITGLVN